MLPPVVPRSLSIALGFPVGLQQPEILAWKDLSVLVIGTHEAGRC